MEYKVSHEYITTIIQSGVRKKGDKSIKHSPRPLHNRLVRSPEISIRQTRNLDLPRISLEFPHKLATMRRRVSSVSYKGRRQTGILATNYRFLHVCKLRRLRN